MTEFLKLQIIFLLICFANPLSGQNFNFKCDSVLNTSISTWNNNFMDSINNLDFSKEDFEFRIWNHWMSQRGVMSEVFIMKHLSIDNKWKAYYYANSQNNKITRLTHKITPNSEIIVYDSKQLAEIWKLFLSKGILLISYPTKDTINKLGGNESLNMSDCHCEINFELIKKDCTHTCYYYPCSSNERMEKLPEYSRFNNIMDIFYKVINREIPLL